MKIVTPELEAKVLKAYQTDQPVKVIATQLGVRQSLIYYVLHKHGVKPGRSPQRGNYRKATRKTRAKRRRSAHKTALAVAIANKALAKGDSVIAVEPEQSTTLQVKVTGSAYALLKALAAVDYSSVELIAACMLDRAVVALANSVKE